MRRNYKDRLFRFIFGNENHKDWALNLYNAMENKQYTDPADLEIVTLENAVYMHMKNDVSMLVQGWNLFFAEQQASLNPSIPYRLLGYCTTTYSKYVASLDNFNPYGKKPIRLPAPTFYVFYNGPEKAKKTDTLKLSDLYYNKPEEPMLELIVKQININGYEGPCVQLYEYEWFVERIRENCKTMQIEKAVNIALDDLPETFTIRQFLMLNKSEVIDMSIFEYDEEKHLRLLRKEAYEEGREEGRLTNMTDLIRRKMNASGISFEDACKDLLLSAEEMAACKDFMNNQN